MMSGTPLSERLFSFHCAACDETAHSGYEAIRIGRDKICRDCFNVGIKPQFEAALDNEEGYPPTSGAVTLHIQDYRHLLPVDLVHRYIKKSREYDVLPRYRVYCHAHQSCGRFLGEATRHEVLHNCHCASVTCMCCRETVINSSTLRMTLPHHCTGSSHVAQHHQLPEDTCGKNWQICPGPGCGALVELMDGCNHVVCTIAACRTHFCFICGDLTATSGYNHWGPAMPCPRYGQPDDRWDIPARRNAWVPVLDDAGDQDFAAAALRPDQEVGVGGDNGAPLVRFPVPPFHLARQPPRRLAEDIVARPRVPREHGIVDRIFFRPEALPAFEPDVDDGHIPEAVHRHIDELMANLNMDNVHHMHPPNVHEREIDGILADLHADLRANGGLEQEDDRDPDPLLAFFRRNPADRAAELAAVRDLRPIIAGADHGAGVHLQAEAQPALVPQNADGDEDFEDAPEA